MKTTKFTLMVIALVLGVFTGRAGGILNTCTDLNGYVSSKNTGGTGTYTLVTGSEEKAAQTYHYSGPGKINKVRVYGSSTLPISPLTVSVYHVDANGRPTGSAIQSANATWYWYNNSPIGSGFIDVSFGGGVSVNSNFAIVLELRGSFLNSFALGYTGNGEGLGEDLASLAGSSTGGNWASALTDFTKDGDFYLIPEMLNYNNPGFTVPTSCLTTGATVTLTNTTQMSKDSMFNIIGWSGYTGSNAYFTWDFGDGSPLSNQTSPSHTFAAAGVYTVTLTTKVQGWNGLCTETYSKNISVGLAVNDTSLANVSCNGGNNGAVVAAGSGGATPYTYSINGVSYQSGTTFTSLTSGNYTLYIRDAEGCNSSATFSISQPAALAFAAPQTTNATCGGSDGRIQVSATGGTGAKKYRLNSGSYGSSGLFSNLAAGAYNITVRDANLCTLTITVVVSNQTAPVLTVQNATNISCHGAADGSITLSASGGGTGTLQYSVNGGASFQTGSSFTGLTAGTYGVLVKDATGCTSGTSVTLTQPSAISFTTSTTPVSCYGGSNGQITVTSAIGGIGTLTYSKNGTNYQSGNTFTGLAAGTYTIYVKDVAGCTSTASVTVTQPTDLGGTAVVTNPGCNLSTDGSLTVTGSGGSGSYTYSISGDGYQSSGVFSNLGADIYVVFVKDKNGCTHTFNATLVEPTPIAGVVLTTNSTCGNSNGSLLVTATGGSGAGYQYSMDGINFSSSGSFTAKQSGTYYVLIRDGAGCETVVSGTITDSNGPVIGGSSHTNVSCNGGTDGTISVSSVSGGTGLLQYGLNGSAWQTASTFTGLAAGSYTVMVKDANGCIGYLNQDITEPAPFFIAADAVDLSCYEVNSGRVTVTAIGGAGTLAYSINEGATYQSSNVFSNLYAGNYTIIVRDAAGCTGEISSLVKQPAEITVLSGVLNVTCAEQANGVISLLSSGGSGPKNYSIDGTNFQSSGTFSGLSGGNYLVYVMDSNYCVKTVNVTVEEPSAISLLTYVSDVTCAGGNNGFVNLSVSGGVGSYSFEWSNNSTDEDLFNLTAGTYSTTVSDANGCESQASFVVSQPAMPIIINGTVTGSTSNDGEVDITVTGGTSPYFFNWSNGAISEDLVNVGPGTYTVEVTDIKGCASSNVFTVTSLTGITDINGKVQNLEIYPNPATQLVNVKMSGSEIEKLRLTDVLGQVVFETENQFSSMEVNTSMLQSGTYYIHVWVGGTVVTKQLQIVR